MKISNEYRKKKCTESQQLNSSMQDDPTEEMQNKQVKGNIIRDLIMQISQGTN